MTTLTHRKEFKTERGFTVAVAYFDDGTFLATLTATGLSVSAHLSGQEAKQLADILTKKD